MEAQACYSLGNTYTLLKDYASAIEYHLRHLAIAQELLDRVGEGRACWSLGNAHSALGQHQEAYQYASKHLAISRATGDKMGQATAQLNIAELSKALGGGGGVKANGVAAKATSAAADAASRRLSMEKMDLLKMTPEVRGNQGGCSTTLLKVSGPIFTLSLVILLCLQCAPSGLIKTLEVFCC